MKAFTRTVGVAAVLSRDNVDTDAIIPKQFMKTVGRDGLGPFAFDAWRYLDEGTLGQDCSRRPRNPMFELNRPEFANARILVTQKNFGCGSSREHAVWALADLGIEVVIAVSFAEIFRTNCLKNGLLPIELQPDTIDALIRDLAVSNDHVSVDLVAEVISTGGARTYPFAIDAGWRQRLVNGWDDVSMTLQYAEDILGFERRQRQQQPWLYTGATRPDFKPEPCRK